MATFKYYDDSTGQATELASVTCMDNDKYAAAFPGVRGRRYDGFSMMVGYADGKVRPVTRAIEYKAWPSRHKCDARCLGGKPNGRCECSCGGKNHGRGMFTNLREAA